MINVLLVEDNDLLRDMYKVKMELSELNVIEARDAQEALDRLDEDSVDIIILDMLLPQHNGIMILQELQSYSDWRSIPIIILSSVKQSEVRMNKEMWEQLNVKRYLYKPRVKPMNLVETVFEIMEMNSDNDS